MNAEAISGAMPLAMSPQTLQAARPRSDFAEARPGTSQNRPAMCDHSGVRSAGPAFAGRRRRTAVVIAVTAVMMVRVRAPVAVIKRLLRRARTAAGPVGARSGLLRRRIVRKVAVEFLQELRAVRLA